jgi:hypothetical protein
MALSDVTVKVNLAQRTGVESDWFPLFVTLKVYNKNQPLAQIESSDYTECTSLQELVELLAPYSSTDTYKEKKAKQELVKQTQIYKAVEAMYNQDDHPNKFAVIVRNDSGSGNTGGAFDSLIEKIDPYLDREWRQLVLTDGFESITDCFKMADYIEHLEQRKLVFFTANSSATVSNVTVDDEQYSLTDFTRTICVYVNTKNQYAHAAIVGATAGKTPGSVNYRNVILNDITPFSVTADELEELHAKGFTVPVERAGDTVTSQGKSASGERYIDTIDIEDYVVQQLIYTGQKVLNVNDKIPYSNDGIAVLENAAIGVMLDCCNKGMIEQLDNGEYNYSVNFPGITEVSDDDMANRTYNLGTVSFTAQGAVDKAEITVEMAM